MREVRRLAVRALRVDGSELGGPGPTPIKPEPSRICVPCPACGAAQELDPIAMARKLWCPLPHGEGEVELRPDRARTYDALEPRGWDVCCNRCGEEFRLVYTLEEWGKMSNAFFPVLLALLH